MALDDTYYPAGWRGGLQYLLATLKLPCDRDGAAALAYDLASRIRRRSFLGVTLTLVFLLVFMIVSITIFMGASAIGGPFTFIPLLFILIVLGIAAAVAWDARSALKTSNELRQLGDAIMTGLLPQDKYCDKTVLQALYTLRATTTPTPQTPPTSIP